MTTLSLSLNRVFAEFFGLLLVLIFGGLLSAAFLNLDRFYLAWIAFVPLLMAIEGRSFKATYALSLIGGLCLYAMGTYWIADFITLSKGLGRQSSILLALLVWLYCAHQIAAIALLFQWLRRKTELSEFILFPVIVAVLTAQFPMLFAMRLGESQAGFPVVLQAIEWTGVHGLDALIALANIALFRIMSPLILNQQRRDSPTKVAWLITLLTIIVWFAYGVVVHTRWQQDMANWKTLTVGIVQPNETPVLGKTVKYPGYSLSYPPEMAMTERLSAQGADVVVWPEAQTKEYLNRSQVRYAYQSRIRDLGVNLVFQDTWQIANSTTGQIERQYNSAIMLNSNGEQLDVYRKMKLIPFGEYLPWVDGHTHSKKILKGFLGEFLNEIDRGDEHVAFNTESVTLVPLICYETTFPEFVANAVTSAQLVDDNQKGSLLVGLTNDGWFGATRQPFQHVIASTLRAVENRVPLVHVANNGPSIVVSPSGQILFESEFRQTGGYLVDVPISPQARGSFYSRHPTLFERTLLTFLVLFGILALRSRNH